MEIFSNVAIILCMHFTLYWRSFGNLCSHVLIRGIEASGLHESKIKKSQSSQAVIR